MEKTANQVEKNVAASFGYVKKDILMLNDSYSNLRDAVNQLASSYKILGEEIKEIKKELAKLTPKKTIKKKENKTISKKVTPKKDDLTIIEGIGNVIQKILNKNNIKTFKDLSKQSVINLKKTLEKEGPRFIMHDPTSWPDQAKLASEGKISQLKKFQEELKK